MQVLYNVYIGISISDCWTYLQLYTYIQLSVSDTFVRALKQGNSATVEEFLDDMNAPALVQSLVLKNLIPGRVENSVRQSGKRDANGHLLKYMKEDVDEETIQRILKEASTLPNESKMNKFAAKYC